MIKMAKIIACLYAGVVAATAIAESITFNGKGTIKGHTYLEFEVYTGLYGNITHEPIIRLEKVKVNEDKLNVALNQGEDVKEVTLIIPGKIQGKQVYIGEEAFQGIDSNRLRLNILFQNNVPNSTDKEWVQLPEDCSELFFRSPSIVKIDLSGAYSLRVKNAAGMFNRCTNLENIDFGSFNAQQIKNMYRMFANCEKLVTLDISFLGIRRNWKKWKKCLQAALTFGK